MSEQAKRREPPPRIVSARFVAGAGPGAELTPPVHPEIAFAGRSNVGKSSLINALVERKGLVRTGSTPGLTRQINLFEARAADGAVFHLVDLPGYGFAKRSKAETASWRSLIEGYLRSRVTLAAVVLIVDLRRGIEDDDRELVDFVERARDAAHRPVAAIVVATKADKLPRAARKVAVEAIRKAAGRPVIGFSAETGEGRDELWAVLRRHALGAVPAALDRTARSR